MLQATDRLCSSKIMFQINWFLSCNIVSHVYFFRFTFLNTFEADCQSSRHSLVMLRGLTSKKATNQNPPLPARLVDYRERLGWKEGYKWRKQDIKILDAILTSIPMWVFSLQELTMSLFCLFHLLFEVETVLKQMQTPESLCIPRLM